MVFELLINLLSPLSPLYGIKYVETNLNYKVTIEYELNDILLWVSTLRLYLLVKLLLFTTYFMSPRAQRILMQHGLKSSALFAVKGVYNTMPLQCIAGSTLIICLLSSLHLQIFEGPMKEVTNMDFTDIKNCLWNVIIILATCGYGDLYPVTFFGRIVGTMIAFYGLFVSSSFTVSMINLLNFSDIKEKGSFKMLNVLILKRDVKLKATQMIQQLFKIKQCKQFTPQNKLKLENLKY